MKIFKIIMAFLIIWGASKEYVSASKQLFTFLDPGIIIGVSLMLLFSAWLFGSGISKEKLFLKSWQYLKFVGATFVIFILFAFVSVLTFKFDPEIVEVNGVRVDIAEMMNGSKGIVPDENQRRKYCICIVTKLTSDRDLVEQYRPELVNGKISKVLLEIQARSDAGKYNLNECMSDVPGLKWTPDFEKSLRISLMKQLTELQISSSHDINRYCDCLIDEYKKVPIKDLTSQDFSNSANQIAIDSLCSVKSKLK